MKAKQVARYLIARHCSKGDVITNKKLQKLLYYTEAWALVYLKSLFDDDIEAWVHGPVVANVYGEYKDFGFNPIHIDTCDDKAVANEIGLNEDQIELIDSVLLKYGPLSSFQLEMLTHSEKPWLEARAGLKATESGTEKINRNTMMNFYKGIASGEKES
jgi:uncharacterized phage-associated protein